jgi:hypothetical protein
MPFKHNKIVAEPDADHAIRIRQMSGGLVIYGAELGFTPAEIAEYATYSADFDTALNVQQEESADVDVIFVELSDAYDDALAKYRACQALVKGEMEFGGTGAVEYLNERFFIGEDLPKNNMGFIKMLEYMVLAQETLGVERPDITLPDAPFDALKAAVAAFDTKLAATGKELSEQKAATASKTVLRKTRGDKLLRKCFHRVLAYWGDDDPRMLEIGLVPKSSIWTPGMPEPGEPGTETPWPGPIEGLTVEIDPIGNILLNWKKVATAVSVIIYKSESPIGSIVPVPPFPEYKTGITGESYTDTVWTPGNFYYYYVVAVNAANEKTAPCAVVSIKYSA